MARFFEGTESLDIANNAVLDTSNWNTLMVRYRDLDNAIDDVHLVGRTNSMFGNVGFSIIMGLSGGNRIIYTNRSGSFALGGGSGSLDNADWHSIAMRVFKGIGQTDRLFIDALDVDSAASRAWTWGSEVFSVGHTTFTQGPKELAEVYWINRELSASEILGWHRGTRAMLLNPDIVALPIWGLQSPEPSLTKDGLTGTITGTPGRVNHPPITLFTPRWAASMPMTPPEPVGISAPPYGQVLFNSADEESRPRYGQRIVRATG